MGTQSVKIPAGTTVRFEPARKISATARVFIGILRLVRWLALTLPRRVARAGWRARWHLAPVVGAAWVLTSSAPVLVLALTTITALLAVFGGHTKIRLGERLYLSQRERYALAEGAIGAAVWTAGEWAAAALGAHTPLLLGAAVYVLLTGHAAGVWWWSRRPTWLRREGKDARLYTGQWDLVAAEPGGLHGSSIVRTSIEALEDGDVSFDVHLAGHADQVNEDARLLVESTITVQGGEHLPHRAVQIAPVDRNVKRVRVTISPARAMEAEPVLSDGIQPLARDGSLVLAADTARRPVKVKRFSKTGVRHAMISGGTDGGKSNTLARLVLPGLLTVNDRGLPIETCWSLDGGRGTSTPYLAPAFDINATQPWQFPILLDAVYAVHLSREDRRGLAGRHDWRTWEEDDQILTLLIQEARGVAPYLTPDQHRKYAAMAMRARKIGLSLIQEGQDFARGNAVGGEDMPEVRKQLGAGGVVLAHRDGDNDKRTLQGSHDATQLVRGVNSLPAGGGWLIPVEQGTVLAKRARTLWDDIDVRAAAARSVTPRPLAGPDLEAAMSVPGFRELYEHRHDPTWTPPEPDDDESDDGPDEALTSGPRPFQPVAGRKTETAADKAYGAILEAAARNEPPIGKTEICKRAGIATGSWHNVRLQLVAEEKIHEPVPGSGKWAPLFPEGKRP